MAPWNAYGNASAADPPTQISFLRLDLRVECHTDEHASIRAVCWVFFLLWPVGCPLLYLVLLLRARRAIVAGEETPLARATRFLWREYRPEWMLWELFDTLRRLFLCGFVLIIPAERSMARLLFAQLLSVVYLCFTLVAAPYKERTLHVLSSSSQLMLVLVFVTCTALKMCETEAECKLLFGVDSIFELSLVAILSAQLTNGRLQLIKAD